MTQLTNRDAHEAAIAEAATIALDEQYALLLDELGTEPPRSGVNETFWVGFAAALTAALQPKLEAAYLDMLIDITAETTIELPEAASMAAEWARGYTFDLVKGMTDNRRALLQGAISDFYDKNLTMGDLYTRLAPEFGAQRAMSIGVTETTRAASAAQKDFADELRGQGVDMVDVILTNNDERVCPVCGPKHGKLARDEGYPPYHVNCRCWVNSIPAAAVDKYIADIP